MPFIRKRDWFSNLLILAVIFVFTNSARADSRDPAESWSRAYSWLQAGEQLAKGEQWALAMGAYIETFRQMKGIRESYPAYEPELVNYRIEKLEHMIAETEQKLPPGGNAITMKFLDFIESYDQGMEQRFANQYSDALGTLDIAKVILDEIIFENPDEFRDAVDSQYMILHSSIEFLEQQITYRARKPRSTFVPDGVDWGTTEFVKQSDLPDGGKTILMSGSLFPRGPDPEMVRDITTAIPELEKTETQPEAGDKKEAGGSRGFRMNSKQKEVTGDQ